MIHLTSDKVFHCLARLSSWREVVPVLEQHSDSRSYYHQSLMNHSLTSACKTSVTHNASEMSGIRSRKNLRTLLLGFSHKDTLFSKRGFRIGNTRTVQQLECIGQTFRNGYHSVLSLDSPLKVGQLIEAEISAEFRGFAFEGAAMAFMLLDILRPWSAGRFQKFINGPAKSHVYITHVGAGWVAGKLPFALPLLRRRLDELFYWLAVDGYGFSCGYFHTNRFIERGALPRRVSGYTARAFDQGLGRSLWFVHCAEPKLIAETIARFEPARQADLWSGVGLACCYAGGASREDIMTLCELSGDNLAQLAQGAAFAAKTRIAAGNPTDETQVACEVILRESVESAAQTTDDTLRAAKLLTPDSAAPVEPLYEIWRALLIKHYSARLEAR